MVSTENVACEPRRTLGAILLSPPLTTGAATLRHLQAAAELLGCDSIEIANLFAIPTSSSHEINEVGRLPQGWLDARPALEQVLSMSHELIAGWGLPTGLHGPARLHHQAQASWVTEKVRAITVDRATEERRAARRVPRPASRGIWTLNGEPRHPSRWHQYVSDRHGRATGPTFKARLATVLHCVDLTEGP